MDCRTLYQPGGQQREDSASTYHGRNLCKSAQGTYMAGEPWRHLRKSRQVSIKTVQWEKHRLVTTQAHFHKSAVYSSSIYADMAQIRRSSNMGVTKLGKPQSSTKFDWSLRIPVVQSPWFSRVWCIQELVLGSNPMIVTRDSMISWGDFAQSGSGAQKAV
jgi:hypothetical protein